MIENFTETYLVCVLGTDGRCHDRKLYNGIYYKEIYNKFKNRFSEEAIKSAWLNDSGINDEGETLLIIGISDIL